MNNPQERIIAGSFRDPSGSLFLEGGILYRQINRAYKEEYDLLIASGLYKDLTESNLLVPHQETAAAAISEKAYKVIMPERLPFISYPYEWCFSQLKDVALITLEIQKRAMCRGMSLKDCSAYNIQFKDGRPILIDTLSFEKYHEGRPWAAYRQFCRHFLAPLALMSRRDIRLSQLLRVYIDGIPLDLCSSLLPFSARLDFSLLVHLLLHAKAEQHFAGKIVKPAGERMSRLSFMGLVDSLESAVRKLKWKAGASQWSGYYEDTNYSSEGFAQKKQIVADFLNKMNAKTIWDIGANTGVFSRVAADKGMQVISLDADGATVEKNYLKCKSEGARNILPLLLDLTNPSSAMGWNNQERMSIFERGPADAALALALIHHLAISNNLPLSLIADFFGRICSWLIIEFVPKEDSQVKRLLATRQDIFPDYTQGEFENKFRELFEIQETRPIKDSQRILYLMKKR